MAIELILIHLGSILEHIQVLRQLQERHLLLYHQTLELLLIAFINDRVEHVSDQQELFDWQDLV